MSDLYYFILDFKESYPIRFWAILLTATLFFSLLIFLMLFLLKKFILRPILLKRNKNSLESSIQEKFRLEEKSSLKRVIAKPRFLIWLTFIQCAVILFLSGYIIVNYDFLSFESEDLSISSSEYIFGIDVSHYQGIINWEEVRTSRHPIEYVFIRATMGVNGRDRYFKRNWESAKKHNYIRGAYHYYRPNENSTKQFENFKSTVKLEKGDILPVLDVEKESRFGRDNLREGVLNWLKLAEEEYGVKPIIYTGLNFYKSILEGHVEGYPLWIAAYSGKNRLRNVEWTFHQFTESMRVKGIQATVDGNDFKGDESSLDSLRIK